MILTKNSPGEPLSEDAKKTLIRTLFMEKRSGLNLIRNDGYGRILVFIFTDSIFVDEEIVGNEFAKAFIIKPNEEYASGILEAERQARLERKGIWGDLKEFNLPPGNKRFVIKPPQVPEGGGTCCSKR